jgi:hypothetical protein
VLLLPRSLRLPEQQQPRGHRGDIRWHLFLSLVSAPLWRTRPTQTTNFMRYDDNRPAFECLRNCVKGLFLKSEAKLRGELVARLNILLEPSKYGPINPNGFAPIRSVRFDSIVKPGRKSNWAFKKPRPARTPKIAKQLSADEIIASL